MAKRVVMCMAVAVLGVVGAGCGDSGSTPGSIGADGRTSQPAATSAVDPAMELATGLEMPAALADFPLPGDAILPFPPTDLSADDDPRESLIVLVTSDMDFAEAAALIDAGLEPAGYVVELRNVTTTNAAWEWSKNGLPGVATASPGVDGGTRVNLNLFRSGTR